MNHKALKTKRKLGRKDSGLLLQVVSGHGLFGGHLKKWNPDIDERCQCCLKTRETSWHHWNECEALKDLRNQTKGRGETIEEKITTFFKSEQPKSARTTRDEYLQKKDKTKQNSLDH